jgi:hypothetical protein
MQVEFALAMAQQDHGRVIAAGLTRRNPWAARECHRKGNALKKVVCQVVSAYVVGY